MAKEKTKKMTRKEEEKLNEKVDKTSQTSHLKMNLKTLSKMPLIPKLQNSIRI